MNRGLFIAICLLGSAFIGASWIPYSEMLGELEVPFTYRGLFTFYFFAPAYMAALLQIKFGQRTPGLIFACESFAALLSGFFGPYGWMSFHFGLAQGLLAEAAFAYRKKALLCLFACAAADLLLLVFHPSLSILRSLSATTWALHIAALLAPLVLIVLLEQRFLKKFIAGCILFFVPLVSYAQCGPLLRAIQNLGAEAKVLVVLDADDVLLDTTKVLVAEVIPTVVKSLEPLVLPNSHTSWQEFLQRLNQTTYPATYSIEHWILEPLSFPVGNLPEGWTLRRFWQEMSVVFRSKDWPLHPIWPIRAEIKRIHASEARVSWAVVTSRTEDQLGPIEAYLTDLPMGREPFQVVSRGSQRGIDSEENAATKLEQIQKLLVDTESTHLIFVDNDVENLSQVATSVESSLLFRVIYTEGEHRIIRFEGP